MYFFSNRGKAREKGLQKFLEKDQMVVEREFNGLSMKT